MPDQSAVREEHRKAAEVVCRKISRHEKAPGVPGCGSCAVIAADRQRAVEAEWAACVKIALNPYGDEVKAYGDDEPSVVGRKIAAAIRARTEDATKEREG